MTLIFQTRALIFARHDFPLTIHNSPNGKRFHFSTYLLYYHLKADAMLQTVVKTLAAKAAAEGMANEAPVLTLAHNKDPF